MPGISADIENEFHAIEREADLLATSLHLVVSDMAPGQPTARLWLDTQGLASGIVKVYSGCERVILRITNSLDRAPLDTDSGWHATLLRRAAEPFENRRGPIISTTCYEALNRFRAFRHRERSSYGADLDLSIVIDRGHEMLSTFRLFQSEIRIFLNATASER